MIPVFIAICVIAGIVISALRIKKLNETRKAEREKEAERLKAHPSEFAETDVQTENGKQKTAFVPAIKDNPFVDATNESTLSAAQLNEWLLDFAAAEKAGASRPSLKELPKAAKCVYDDGRSFSSADKSYYREKFVDTATCEQLLANRIEQAALPEKERGKNAVYISFYKNKN